jgi:DNA polymerase III epsilon subunit-like protein
MDPGLVDSLEHMGDLGAVKVAVIDVETSGLSPEEHHLLQVAVIVVNGRGEELLRWSSDIRPPWGIFGHVGPQHIHGLTRGRLWRAPGLTAVLRQLQPLLVDAVVAGHNVGFDLAFLEAASRRTGIALPSTASLCTLELSRRLDPERRRRHRLGDLCEFYGIGLERPHDALADAEATAALLTVLLRNFDVVRPADVATLIRTQGPVA